MNEFDEVDFQGAYLGKALMDKAEINQIPWDVGHSQDVVKHALENIQPGYLLDVGCGTGENAEFLAARGFRVTALDFSVKAVEEARKRHPDSVVSYISHDILQADDSWSGDFDVVLDSATYHTIPSTSRSNYLQTLYSYLRPGGHLITITFADHPKGMPASLAVDKESLLRSLYKSGFSDVSIELGFYNGVYAAIDKFIEKYELTIDKNQDGESLLPVWVARSYKG